MVRRTAVTRLRERVVRFHRPPLDQLYPQALRPQVAKRATEQIVGPSGLKRL